MPRFYSLRTWFPLALLVCALSWATVPAQGQTVSASDCARKCITARVAEGQFCVNALKNDMNGTLFPFILCIAGNQCDEGPKAGDFAAPPSPGVMPALTPSYVAKLSGRLFLHCNPIIYSDAIYLGQLIGMQHTASMPIIRDGNAVVSWYIQLVLVCVFNPLFFYYRDQRIIRHRHWVMCIGLSVIFLIYQGLVVFFYTTVSNLLTISEGKIRAWIVMTMICCGLVYPGFFSLIISHYVRDRVQQLRCTLRAQLPQVYFYDRVSTGSSAGAAYHVHAVNHSTSTNISLQASELSTHLTKSPSVAAVLHGDRRRTTIVPPVPLTERSIKTSVSSTTPLNDVASGLTRSGTRKDVANIPPAIAKTGELTELRGEKLHEAAERLRKLSKFDKEYCSLLYFLVTAVPVFCFVTWLLSSKLGKPDFEGFMVYYYFICALIADVLVLLSQPWNQLSDNFGVKYQISTAAVLVTAYQSGTVYSWARAVSHEEERDKIGLIMSWFLVFFPIVYQLLLIVIPTVIAIIPSNQDTVHRSGVGLWFLRSQTTAGSEQSLAAPSWDDSSSQTSTYPRMDSISGGGLTDATKKSSGGDSTPPVSENRTVIIAEPREADRLERPRTTSGGGLKATAPTTKQKSRPRSAAYPPTRELDAILFNAQALQALTQFSAHEYCTENLLFLGAAFEYRVQYNRKTSEARMAYAETIYNDYVRAGSFNEVNLPGTLRRELDHALHKDAVAQKEQWQGQLIFEDAVDHIKHMLATDILPRFKRSKFYISPGPQAV